MITIDGYDINYKITGDGTETVVILQGWGTTLEVYDSIARVLAPAYRVVQLDLPGFGGSSEPREPWNVKAYCRFFEKFMAALHIEKAHLIGHSYGGRMIIRLAAEGCSFEIGKILLVDAAGIVPRKSFATRTKIRVFKMGKWILTRSFVYGLIPETVDGWMSQQGSADYRSATGIDRRSEREEYGARASVNHTTKSGLFTFSANIAPRVVKSVDADQNVFFYAIEANPTTPVHDPDDPSKYFNFFGQQASYNPVESIYSEKKDHDIRYLDWDATARLNIMEGLSTQVTFSDQHIQNYERMFRPSTYTESINKGWSGGEASQKYSEDSRYSLEWLANWQKNIKDHNIKVMLGYSYQYFQHSEFFAENKNFPNDGLTYNDLEAGSWAGEEGKTGVKSARYDSKLIAFFGRVNYDYKGKYLLTLSYRREGSSKFGANNKWGNFPAVSAGWRISQENFMRSAGWINDLKIRADFGVTGNQNFDSYLSLSTMTGYEEYYYDGSWFTVWGASKNANPDLKWELGINWNVGLDFSLLDYRLTGSVNYYNRTQQDLLGDYNVPVPPYLFPTTYANVGTMRNSGVEIELNWDAVRTGNFSYSIGFVGATISNKMVSFSNPLYRGQDWYDEVETQSPFPFYYLQRLQVGERIGNFCMYEFAGFNKQGQWLIYDKNGELKAGLDANDEDKKIVGNGLPQSINFDYWTPLQKSPVFPRQQLLQDSPPSAILLARHPKFQTSIECFLRKQSSVPPSPPAELCRFL